MSKNASGARAAARSSSNKAPADVKTAAGRQAGGKLRPPSATARKRLGRPELNEDQILLQVEQLRRAQGCSQRKAITRFLGSLECVGVDRQGERTVRMPDGRFISISSARKHLQRKAQRCRTKIAILADAAERGRELGRYWAQRVTAQPGCGPKSPIAVPYSTARPSSSTQPPYPYTGKAIPSWARGVAAKALTLEMSRLLKEGAL